MSEEQISLSAAFGPEHAANYDAQFTALAPIKDLMHLVLHAHLAHLPDNARLLIAGAGTGAEVRFLANLFPGWHFTLADPSAAMLDVARKHAEAEGFAARCQFHADYVSALQAEAFDGATSLLVSHFLTEPDARIAYYRSIAERLKPGAPLFNADLCADADAPDFAAILNVWLGFMQLAGMDEIGQEKYIAAFGHAFACHGPAEVVQMLETGGFTPPAQCYQAGLIRGWVTERL